MNENTWKQDAQELDRSRSLSLTLDQLPGDVPTIAGYQIVEKLGQGQYGSVWKAVDLNARIPVAIKVFRQSGGLDYALLHGEVEKLIALCEDQRIVSLREVGWDAEPPYFVMDFLENSLDKRLRDGPLSMDEAVGMFEQIVAGLVHAHNKGIMHCDLKPGNILLDHESQPRIADFGQSRLSTQHTPALGTLFYMAPEQADLKGVPDARWDVYAAGAVLYCMLTGAAPYQSEAARKQLSEADTAPTVLARYREIIRDAPKPTEHHRVPGIDKSLVEIIDRCLEKDPRRRYANAQAIREALHMRSRWLRQKPVLALGIALPLVFLLLMSGAFWYQIIGARDLAIVDMEAAARDSNRSFAAAVTGSVARQFDRRWRSLTSLADKEDFTTALQEWSREAAGKRAGGPQTEAYNRASDVLQHRVDQYQKAEFQGTNGIAWFVLDGDGYMAAFSSRRKIPTFIGGNFKHRDYVRGVLESKSGDDVYVSRAFRPSNAESGEIDKDHVLVFSVPVRAAGGSVIGVLGMAVPVGVFAEIVYANLETFEAAAALDSDYRWIPQFASLVDTRPTEPPKQDAEHAPEVGLVLQHAFYKLYGSRWYDDHYEQFPQAVLPGGVTAVLRTTVDGAAELMAKYATKFKDAEQSVDALDEKRRLTSLRNEELAKLYATNESDLARLMNDPFYEWDSRFDARADGGWIVSSRPVLVQRPGSPAPITTGLVVLVQQRRDVVRRSALAMSSSMLRRAGVLFAIAGVLMLGVWFYGFTLLNPTSQSRLTRAIWRITGVRTARSARTGGSGTGTGLSTRSGASAQTPAPQ